MIGRFGSADPITENPYSTQGWNRYSFVGNSPLNFTDPSGYCFMGCFWKPMFKAVGSFLRQAIGTILPIAAGAICAVLAPGTGAVCAALATTVVSGVSSGDWGQALKAGLVSLATATAFNMVGDMTTGLPGAPGGGHAPLDFGSVAHLFNMAGHAAVGCASSVAGGGKCGPGALAGAVGSFGGPLMRGQSFEFRVVASAVLGGAASAAAGGSFANGAVTGAFGYLFNEVAARQNLGEGYTARIDPFNYKGQSLYEIHVFNPQGNEIGIYGPEGWIYKHGFRSAPDLPFGVLNSLRGITIDELRSRGLIPPKGEANIKGVPTEDLYSKYKKSGGGSSFGGGAGGLPGAGGKGLHFGPSAPDMCPGCGFVF